MNLSKCLLHHAGTVLTALVLVGALYLGWANFVAPDFWDLPEQARLLEEGKEREHDLDVRQKALYQCVKGKDRVAREVIAGRLSLLEAAAQFRDLSLARPDFNLVRFRQIHPGASDQERYCRAVMVWVQALLEDQPEKGRGVVMRLETELAELLTYGSLQLDT